MNKFFEMSTGTYGLAVFTFINAFCSGVGSFFLAVALVFLDIKYQPIWAQFIKFSKASPSAADDAWLAIPIVFFLLWLSFSIVLFAGICKRKASLVMCFFLYGVVILIVGIALLLYAIIEMDSWPTITLLFLFPLFDGPALFMIIVIFNTFRKEVQFQSLTNLKTPLDKF